MEEDLVLLGRQAALVAVIEVVEIGRGQDAGAAQGVDEAVDGLEAADVVALQVGALVSVKLRDLAVHSPHDEQHAIDAVLAEEGDHAVPHRGIGKLAGQPGADQEWMGAVGVDDSASSSSST